MTSLRDVCQALASGLLTILEAMGILGVFIGFYQLFEMAVLR